MRDPRSPRTAAWLLCFTWLVACSSWPLAAVSRGLRQDPGTPVPSPSPATDGSGGTGDGSGGTADPAPVDCAKFVDHCGACRFQSFGGTVTRAICMRCDIGYEVKNSGRDCWCAPGYYLDDTTGDCAPCGTGYHCPGAKATKESGATRLECGANKDTLTQFARSPRECVVKAGYGWFPGDALPCAEGFYNPGYNTRRCTSCSGGLTTLQEGSTSPADCVAPKGHAYMRGKAVPCGRGSYKDTAGNVDCTQCPEGFTTAATVVASENCTDCNYVTAGYQATALMAVGLAPATLCPVDTYRTGDAAYDPAAGISCQPCPTNMRTQQEGSESADACLAPPGYGYNATSGDAYICPTGTYNPGWNREPCIPCGAGSITTDGPGAASPDDCKLPAGHGSALEPGDVLVGAPCDVGSYGRGADSYGLIAAPCTLCPEFTTTNGTGSTDASQCVTLPGYGWTDGGTVACDYGYWSAGGTQDPCTPCGYGYTTTVNGSTSPADVTMGATSADQCVIAAGYTPLPNGGLKPCPIGLYKALLGPSACIACPAHTTTKGYSAAAKLGDCDACAAGFGSPTPLDPEAPSCSLCPSGTFAPGRVDSGPCVPCPKAPNYTGRMVSRPGISTPEGCFAEFDGDGARPHITYDYITMSDAALSLVNGTNTVEACQAACAADQDCQYFAFDSEQRRCQLRNKVPYSKVDVNDASKSYAVFEISYGRYVAYEAHPSDAESLGQPLKDYATLRPALTACTADVTCIGLKSAPAGAWRTFAGTQWEGVTGKVRVVGESIDVWVTATTST